jgi:spore maturation protein CgeB
VFEAAGAAACLITDHWEGIDQFLRSDEEVLVARDGREVADHLSRPHPRPFARAIGEAARRRVLAEHTYARRADEADALFRRTLAARRERSAA